MQLSEPTSIFSISSIVTECFVYKEKGYECQDYQYRVYNYYFSQYSGMK